MSAPQHAVDLDNCDKEPIHIPASIQPHGLLVTLRPESLTVAQASENVAQLCGQAADALPGQRLADIFSDMGQALENKIAATALSNAPGYIDTVTIGSGTAASMYNVLAHQFDGVIFVEFERAATDEALIFQNLYPLIQAFIAQLQEVATLEQVYALTANEVKRLTGYGRVLIYRFDADWHGHVVAEARDAEQFPSLSEHHFPASDIPRQARELYRLNRLRIIPDANYQPVAVYPALNPVTGKPLNMSYSALRSVSPMHVEYMKNMETLASMSISIIVENRLWGLIACHNRSPRLVPFEMRSACDFISQFLSLQISTKVHASDYAHRMALKALTSELLTAMTGEVDFTEALGRHGKALLDLTGADGCAVIYDKKCRLLGHTPPEASVWQLAEWLSVEEQGDLFFTDSLSGLYAPGMQMKDVASGVLAISISELHSSTVIWFRPEVVQTVKWSGEPVKQLSGDNVIHPRTSFKTWKEVVSLKSQPWRDSEINAAKEFRHAVVGIVLRRAEEMAELSSELERTNHELEAFSSSVSHDLRAPFRHIVGYAELIKENENNQLSARSRKYLDNVIEAGQYAGQLVDNLLHFSQVGRLPIEPVSIDMDLLLSETMQDVMTEAAGRSISWRVDPLPAIKGDLLLMRLVVRNLLANAVKYTRHKPEAMITVSAAITEREIIFSVKDNGVGFEMEYVDKLFGVFQRLHKMEDFEGTGIGLANVKRIIIRHGGRVWAEGEPDNGASFYFTLPTELKGV